MTLSSSTFPITAWRETVRAGLRDPSVTRWQICWFHRGWLPISEVPLSLADLVKFVAEPVDAEVDSEWFIPVRLGSPASTGGENK